MFSDIKRLSSKHKNNKPAYYGLNYLRLTIPSLIFRKRLDKKLAAKDTFDSDYIEKRVNYYNRLTETHFAQKNTETLSALKKRKFNTYFFDSYEYVRYFNPDLKANFLYGDIVYVPSEPSFVKSRPISGDISNSVILKLNKIRHFLFVKDKLPFAEKKSLLVGRSKARQSQRIRFLEMYFNHPLCDIGQVNRNMNPQFIASRMTISEQLQYKFILCLEGNDVASNLKWVMSSNSLAVMPKPKFETWFMEGTLIPDFHYVEIKEDYTDLEEKLIYYSSHIDEAQKIIENAHQYVEQFKNKKQEDLISLLVLKKYFERTGQKINS